MKKSTQFELAFLMLSIFLFNSCTRNLSANYEDFFDNDVIAMESAAFIQRFGEPDTKNKVAGSEIWTYGPTIEDMRNSKKGDVIGVSVAVSEKGFVIRCDAIHRDL